MVSKLSDQMTTLTTVAVRAVGAISEFLKYRIQYSTTVDSLIPKARAAADGKFNGATADVWFATAQDLKTKMANSSGWADYFVTEMTREIARLQTMVDNYDPMRTKKNKSLPVERIEQRTAKKKAAIDLIAKAKSTIKDVNETMRV